MLRLALRSVLRPGKLLMHELDPRVDMVDTVDTTIGRADVVVDEGDPLPARLTECTVARDVESRHGFRSYRTPSRRETTACVGSSGGQLSTSSTSAVRTAGREHAVETVDEVVRPVPRADRGWHGGCWWRFRSRGLRRAHGARGVASGEEGTPQPFGQQPRCAGDGGPIRHCRSARRRFRPRDEQSRADAGIPLHDPVCRPRAGGWRRCTTVPCIPHGSSRSQ
jgi:hypothetical protein